MLPWTLFQLAGREPAPPVLAEAVLAQAARLLGAARAAGSRIVHVAHCGVPGGLFGRDEPRGAIIAALAPTPGEAVIEKVRPNAFSDTGLAACIGPAGTAIIVAGFMTHNCVSSTVRAALDLGYGITVAADACMARDLPSPKGVIAAADLHAAEVAALADRHACVVRVDEILALPRTP